MLCHHITVLNLWTTPEFFSVDMSVENESIVECSLLALSYRLSLQSDL